MGLGWCREKLRCDRGVYGGGRLDKLGNHRLAVREGSEPGGDNGREYSVRWIGGGGREGGRGEGGREGGREGGSERGRREGEESRDQSSLKTGVDETNRTAQFTSSCMHSVITWTSVIKLEVVKSKFGQRNGS